MTRFVFNPFTGTFDVAAESTIDPFVFAATCQATDAVNQFVYVAGDAVGGVAVVACADPTDPAKMPAIGMILSKSSATDCVVVWLGVVALAGLTPNARYFLDSTGFAVDSLSAVRPVIVQVLGQALDSGRLLLTPSKDLLRLNT